jgi:hypothetical protein
MKMRSQSTSRENLVLTDDNPARFLATLYDMSIHPDRASLAFDHEDLEWAANVWNQAAIAGLGDPEFIQWRDFYQHWCDKLKAGELEAGCVGCAWFDQDSEWPRKEIVGRAIQALAYAGMATVGVVGKPSLYRSVQ